MTLDENCKWNKHIETVIKNGSKQRNVLRKLKFMLNKCTLFKIYKAYILPLFEYCCEVWDGCSLSDADKLEKLQLEVLKFKW